jgi:hypothetical protein
MKCHCHVGRLQQAVHQPAENGSTASPWDRWRLAGEFGGEAFSSSTRHRDGSVDRMAIVKRRLLDCLSKFGLD